MVVLQRRAALFGVALGVALVVGCEAPKQLPNTKAGAFLMIEGGVNDIVSSVMSATYKSNSRDLGTDSDRIGIALGNFLKETEGTPLAEDAQSLKTKFGELEKLVASRAAVDKQREAAKAVQAVVTSIKGKL